LHHTIKGGKDTKAALRGSGDLSAFADIVFMIGKNANKYHLRQVKNRHGELIQKIGFKLIEKQDGALELACTGIVQSEERKTKVDLAKDEIEKFIVKPENDEFRTKDILDYMSSKGHTATTVKQALMQLVEQGILIHPYGKYKCNFFPEGE